MNKWIHKIKNIRHNSIASFSLKLLIQHSIFITFLILGLGDGSTQFISSRAQTASPGDNLVVCGNSNWGGLNQPRTLAMRNKLLNTANFGPGGQFSESTISFANIGTPSAANLAANNCNIWFSGYDTGTYTALSAFISSGGFVIGGCDSLSNSAACLGVGVTVTNFSNIGGGYSTLPTTNPLACDGESENLSLVLTTAGGASSYFTSGITVAQYNGSGQSLAILDSATTPNYLLTGDIDMFTTNNPQVTTGNTIISDQDKFIANAFKLAADSVTGSLAANGGVSCENISYVYTVTVVKAVDTTNVTTLPSALSYTITVDNTGTGNLAVPILSDTLLQSGNSLSFASAPVLSSGDTNLDGVLDVDETWVYSATYNVTQSNMDDEGDITNMASFAATSLTAVESNLVTTTISPSAALLVTKVADKLVNVSVGEVVIYTYTVTNVGNQTISNVALVDSHNGSGSSPAPENETLATDSPPTSDSIDSGNNGVWETLAPGDIVTFTGEYVVTQQDIDTLQ